MTNKILLIIDPQIDFINGTLPVPRAESAMNSFADYISLNGMKYDHIIMPQTITLCDTVPSDQKEAIGRCIV